MKRFVLTAVAALVAASAWAQGTTAPAPAGTQNIRIGVINVERLVQESALGKEASRARR